MNGIPDLEKGVEILRRYGATKIVLFGSAIENPHSARDIDLAVEGIRGWVFFRAADEVEKALGRPVDMIPLSPPSRFTRYVERKGRVVYEQ